MKHKIPALSDLFSGATSEDFQRLQTPSTQGKGAQCRRTGSEAKSTASELPAEHTHWLTTLKTRIAVARYRAALAANVELIRLYWQIGREILQRQAQQGWDSKAIDSMACDLKVAYPGTKGFSRSNLNYMRAFAEAWPDEEVVQQAVALLPWDHNVLLLTMLEDSEERLRYAEQAVADGWSRSTLEANIRDNLVKRSGNTT